MKVWSVALRALAAATMIAYPAFVWLGLSSGSPRQVAIVLLALMTPAYLLRRSKLERRSGVGLAAAPLTILGLLVVSAVFDGADFIRATPVAANVVLLISFGATLRRGSVPMIERFARLQEPDLDASKQAWCRAWTKIWCAFFVANGAVALALAALADLRTWALYNGGIAYALIGALFALEWLLRRRRFPDLRARRAAEQEQ